VSSSLDTVDGGSDLRTGRHGGEGEPRNLQARRHPAVSSAATCVMVSTAADVGIPASVTAPLAGAASPPWCHPAASFASASSLTPAWHPPVAVRNADETVLELVRILWSLPYRPLDLPV
jgi:hypothetical protein